MLSLSTPWRSRVTERGVFEIDVWLDHPTFNSTSLQVRDAVLADVAHYITSEEAATVGHRDGASYGDILVTLRNKYAIADSLEPNQLRIEIDELRKTLIGTLFKESSTVNEQEIRDALSVEEVHRVESSYIRGPSTARLVDYLEMRHLAQLFLQHPARFFDTGCFKRAWNPILLVHNSALLTEYQQQLTQDVWIAMIKLGEFTNPFVPPLDLNRSYLVLIQACIGRLHSYMTDMDGSYV